MSSANRLVISMLVVTALAVAFWILALSPKQQQASALDGQVSQLRATLATAQAKAIKAESARRDFPTDYQQLVVLGKAVPNSDNTSSLLVVLSRIARRSKLRFNSIALGSGSGGAAPATPVTATSATAAGSSTGVAAAAIPPTEAAASLLPLGATIGPAGLGVMPYNLTFAGSFFHVADFIRGIDALVHDGGHHVAVDGRLVTLDGFALNEDPERHFPYLDASFSVTTYLTPPSQGITAGASAGAPAPSTAELTASTTSSSTASDPSSTPGSNPR